MSSAEITVLIFTLSAWAMTIIKVHDKKTRWWWNCAPFMIGFTTCLWLAKIFG